MRTFMTISLMIGGMVSAGILMQKANAQAPTCGAHDILIGQLHSQHSEDRVATAVTYSGQLVEVMVSEVGTWTVLISQARGPTCIVAFGDGWQARAPVAGDQFTGSASDPKLYYGGGY